jgi:hypothetical protein
VSGFRCDTAADAQTLLTCRASYDAMHMNYPPRVAANASQLDTHMSLVFENADMARECASMPTLCNRHIGLTKGMYVLPKIQCAPHSPPPSTHRNQFRYFPNKSNHDLFISNHDPGFVAIHRPYSSRDACSNDFLWRPRMVHFHHANDYWKSHVDRKSGFCCNHIATRSVEDFVAKLAKNRNFVTFNLGHVVATNLSSAVWRFWERVVDRDALELKQLLA